MVCMADNVIEDPITPHVSSYLRRPLRTLKEAEKTIRDSSEVDKAVVTMRGQPQTEDSKKCERFPSARS